MTTDTKLAHRIEIIFALLVIYLVEIITVSTQLDKFASDRIQSTRTHDNLTNLLPDLRHILPLTGPLEFLPFNHTNLK